MDELQLQENEEALIHALRMAMMSLDQAGKIANVLYGEGGEVRQEAMQAYLGVCLLLDKSQNTIQTRKNNEAALLASGLRVVK